MHWDQLINTSLLIGDNVTTFGDDPFDQCAGIPALVSTVAFNSRISRDNSPHHSINFTDFDGGLRTCDILLKEDGLKDVSLL